jgi:hypothetical protein
MLIAGMRQEPKATARNIVEKKHLRHAIVVNSESKIIIDTKVVLVHHSALSNSHPSIQPHYGISIPLSFVASSTPILAYSTFRAATLSESGLPYSCIAKCFRPAF